MIGATLKTYLQSVLLSIITAQLIRLSIGLYLQAKYPGSIMENGTINLDIIDQYQLEEEIEKFSLNSENELLFQGKKIAKSTIEGFIDLNDFFYPNILDHKFKDLAIFFIMESAKKASNLQFRGGADKAVSVFVGKRIVEIIVDFVKIQIAILIAKRKANRFIRFLMKIYQLTFSGVFLTLLPTTFLFLSNPQRTTRWLLEGSAVSNPEVFRVFQQAKYEKILRRLLLRSNYPLKICGPGSEEFKITMVPGYVTAQFVQLQEFARELLCALNDETLPIEVRIRLLSKILQEKFNLKTAEGKFNAFYVIKIVLDVTIKSALSRVFFIVLRGLLELFHSGEIPTYILVEVFRYVKQNPSMVVPEDLYDIEPLGPIMPIPPVPHPILPEIGDGR